MAWRCGRRRRHISIVSQWYNRFQSPAWDAIQSRNSGQMPGSASCALLKVRRAPGFGCGTRGVALRSFPHRSSRGPRSEPKARAPARGDHRCQHRRSCSRCTRTCPVQRDWRFRQAVCVQSAALPDSAQCQALEGQALRWQAPPWSSAKPLRARPWLPRPSVHPPCNRLCQGEPTGGVGGGAAGLAATTHLGWRSVARVSGGCGGRLQRTPLSRAVVAGRAWRRRHLPQA